MPPQSAIPTLPDIERIRQDIQRARQELSSHFLEKETIIDLLFLSTIAQEPLLLVGKPGTAKSILIETFCETLGVPREEYFAYTLTKFTEPSELFGPVDIAELKHGRHIRRTQGKIPTSKFIFLDEIFNGSSAILNSLLTILNEKVFYQDGRATPVETQMIFAATNQIPVVSELEALRDRFCLKVQSDSVADSAFSELLSLGLEHERLNFHNQRPWQGLVSYVDLTRIRDYILQHVLSNGRARIASASEYFTPESFAAYKRIVRSLKAELGVELSDRRLVKITKLLLTHALITHGGLVQLSDLQLLRFVANQQFELDVVDSKVRALLGV